jgi:hypothetical protein
VLWVNEMIRGVFLAVIFNCFTRTIALSYSSIEKIRFKTEVVSLVKDRSRHFWRAELSRLQTEARDRLLLVPQSEGDGGVRIPGLREIGQAASINRIDF